MKSINDFNLILESLGKFTKSIISFGILLGFLIVYVYNVLIINFFPSALTLGDTLLFIFLAITFSIFYGFIFGVAYLAVVFYLTPILDARTPDRKISKLEGGFSIIISCLFLIMFIAVGVVTGSVLFILTVLLVAIILFFYFKTEVFKGSGNDGWIVTPAGKVIFALILVVSPLMLDKDLTKILVSLSFEKSGIMHKSSSLMLNEDAWKTVNTIQLDRNLKFSICPNKSGYRVFNNIEVLWHGLGDITLVKAKALSGESVKLELNSENIRLFKHYDAEENNIPRTACVDYAL